MQCQPDMPTSGPGVGLVGVFLLWPVWLSLKRSVKTERYLLRSGAVSGKPVYRLFGLEAKEISLHHYTFSYSIETAMLPCAFLKIKILVMDWLKTYLFC